MSEIQGLTLHIFSTENHQNQSQWLDPELDQPENIIASVMGQQTVSSCKPGWIQKGKGSQNQASFNLFKHFILTHKFYYSLELMGEEGEQ